MVCCHKKTQHRAFLGPYETERAAKTRAEEGPAESEHDVFYGTVTIQRHEQKRSVRKETNK